MPKRIENNYVVLPNIQSIFKYPQLYKDNYLGCFVTLF